MRKHNHNIELGNVVIKRNKKEESDLLLEAVKITNVAICLVSPELKIVYSNDALDKLFGYKKGELIGKPIWMINAGPTPKAMTRNIVNSIDKHGYWEGKIKNKRKDNDEFICYASIHGVRNKNGQIINYISTQIDVTDQERIQELLIENEARYRGLFDDSPIAIWDEDWSELKTHIESLPCAGDKDFSEYFDNHPEEIQNCANKIRIIDVNRATLDLYKAKTKKEYFDSLEETFTEESYEIFKKTLISIAEGKTVYESEVLNRTLEGDQKYIKFRWSVASDFEKTMSKVIVTAMDITDLKRAEEMMQESELKLKEQKLALEEKNIALKEIIAQVELEKQKLKESVEANINNVISPILEKLKIDKPSKKYVYLLQHHLKGLLSSYGIKIKKRSVNLTPREIEICNMIKSGLATKDISSLLNIS